MACTVACKAENQTRPGIFWNIVKTRNSASTQWSPGYFYLCLVCTVKSPCVNVCPTGASHREKTALLSLIMTNASGVNIVSRPVPTALVTLMGIRRLLGTELTEMEKIGFSRQNRVVENALFVLTLLRKAKNRLASRLALAKPGILETDDPDSKVSQLIKSRHGTQLLRNWVLILRFITSRYKRLNIALINYVNNCPNFRVAIYRNIRGKRFSVCLPAGE